MSNFFSEVGDFLFGEEGTPNQVVNTTPQAFQNLINPLSNALLSRLNNPQQWLYGGRMVAPLQQGERNALSQISRLASSPGFNQGAYQLQQLAQGGQVNPFAALSGLERQGINQIAQQAFNPSAFAGVANPALQQIIGGQMNPFAQAAGLGAGEQAGLQAIQQQAFATNPQIQQFINSQLQGQMNPFAQISSGEQNALNAIQQSAFGTNPLQGSTNQAIQQLIGGQQNPYAQQLMDAAVRPILQNFDDQALAARGLYTGAGHQIQGEGSSPFAQASARLAGNVANAVGDTTAQLGANLFNQQQQGQIAGIGLGQQGQGQQFNQQLQALGAAGLPRSLMSDAFNQQQANQFAAASLGDQFAQSQFGRALAGTEALSLPRQIQQLGLDLQSNAFQQNVGNQLSGISLGDQLSGNALQRALAGLQGVGTGQERQASAFENQADRQQSAAGQLGSLQLQQQQQQLEAALSNLQAQGLPRMISQLGIDAGLSQFDNQQRQIMDLMRMIGSLASPNSVLLPGTQGSGGLVGGIAEGLGPALGSGLGGLLLPSDRRLKKDIQHAGNVGKTRWYRFRYLTDSDDAPLRVGVMADEVRHIPGAVTRHNDVDYVDYGKVLAHA